METFNIELDYFCPILLCAVLTHFVTRCDPPQELLFPISILQDVPEIFDPELVEEFLRHLIHLYILAELDCFVVIVDGDGSNSLVPL